MTELSSSPRSIIEAYRPSNRIKALSAQASSVQVDNHVAAKLYFRSSSNLLKIARSYLNDGNLENAFVLYQKYLSLIVEKLPSHPEFTIPANRDARRYATKQCKDAFTTAEKIKENLTAQYTVQFEKVEKEQEERLRQLKLEEERKKSEEERLEKDRIEREEAEAEYRKKKAAELEDQKYAHYLQQELDKQNNLPSAPPAGVNPPDSFQQPPPPSYAPVSHLPLSPPTYDQATNDPPQIPMVDRSTKPIHFTQTQTDVMTSSNKYGMKTVFVPIGLASSFGKLAHNNTIKNMETCGLLFGKLEKGAFYITHVVIPKQKGAPDSCTMLNEEEIFQFHDDNDLIQLGWIHTHPTQTAFLSSVDLHTHAGYQLMMPEAIAIVVSPKHDEVGVFQLTPEHGLGYISKCTKAGFHPHPKDPPLFQDCEHVKMDQSYQSKFVDLRA